GAAGVGQGEVGRRAHAADRGRGREGAGDVVGGERPGRRLAVGRGRGRGGQTAGEGAAGAAARGRGGDGGGRGRVGGLIRDLRLQSGAVRWPDRGALRRAGDGHDVGRRAGDIRQAELGGTDCPAGAGAHRERAGKGVGVNRDRGHAVVTGGDGGGRVAGET